MNPHLSLLFISPCFSVSNDKMQPYMKHKKFRIKCQLFVTWRQQYPVSLSISFHHFNRIYDFKKYEYVVTNKHRSYKRTNIHSNFEASVNRKNPPFKKKRPYRGTAICCLYRLARLFSCWEKKGRGNAHHRHFLFLPTRLHSLVH